MPKTCFTKFTKGRGISVTALSVMLTTFAVVVSSAAIISLMTISSTEGANKLAKFATQAITDKTLREVQSMASFLSTGAEAVQFSIKLRPTAPTPSEDVTGWWWWIKWQSWTYLFSKNSQFSASEYSVKFIDGSSVSCVSGNLINCDFKRAATKQELSDYSPQVPRGPANYTTTEPGLDQVPYSSLIQASFGFNGDLVRHSISENIYYDSDPRTDACFQSVSTRMFRYIDENLSTPQTTTSPASPYSIDSISSTGNAQSFPDSLLAVIYTAVTIEDDGSLKTQACYPIVNATNHFIGVGTLSVNMNTLQQLIDKAQPTERGNIVILDDWDRVLATSTSGRVTYVNEDGIRTLHTVQSYCYQALKDLLSIVGWSNTPVEAPNGDLFYVINDTELHLTSLTPVTNNSNPTNQRAPIQQLTLDGEGYYVSVSDLSARFPSLGWRVLVLVPTSDIMHTFRVGTFASLGVSIGLVFGVSFLAAILGKLLFRPLGRIAQNMKAGQYLRMDPAEDKDENPLSKSQTGHEGEQFTSVEQSNKDVDVTSNRFNKDQKKQQKLQTYLSDRSISYLSDVAAIQRAYWTMADELAVLKGYIPEHIRHQLLEGKLNSSLSTGEDCRPQHDNAREGNGGNYSDEEMGDFVVVSPESPETEKKTGQLCEPSSVKSAHNAKQPKNRFDHPSTIAKRVAFAPTSSADSPHSQEKITNPNDADASISKASNDDNKNITISDTEMIKSLVGIANAKASENAFIVTTAAPRGVGGHASPSTSSPPTPSFNVFQNSLSERHICVAVVNLVGFHQYVAKTPVSRVTKDHEAIVAFIHDTAKRCGGVLDTFNGDKFWVSFNATTPCEDGPIAATLFACLVDKALNGKKDMSLTANGSSKSNNYGIINNNNNSNSFNDFRLPSSTASSNVKDSPPSVKYKKQHPNAKSPPVLAATPHSPVTPNTSFHPPLIEIVAPESRHATASASNVSQINLSNIGQNPAALLGCTIGLAKGIGYVGALGTKVIKRHTVISNALSEASALERMATKYPDCKVMVGAEMVPYLEGYFQYVVLDASVLPGSGGLRNRVAGVKGLMLMPGFMFPHYLRAEVCRYVIGGNVQGAISQEAVMAAMASLPHNNPYGDINHCFMLYLEGRSDEAMIRLQVINAQVQASIQPSQGFPSQHANNPQGGKSTDLTQLASTSHPYYNQNQLGARNRFGAKPLSSDEASSISLVMECLDLLIRSMDGRAYQSPLGVLF